MANRDEGMGLGVAGAEVEAVVVDRVVVGEGEEEVSSGVPCRPPTT